jgi:hypothetical protein
MSPKGGRKLDSKADESRERAYKPKDLPEGKLVRFENLVRIPSK